MVSKGESQGRNLDPGGGFTRKHDRRGAGPGPERPTPLHLGTDKNCHVPCAITLSPHRRCPLWKKVWSPACPLNGSFQSPNCPLKGIFSIAKRDFIVANGRMAADFSSPDVVIFFWPWALRGHESHRSLAMAVRAQTQASFKRWWKWHH